MTTMAWTYAAYLLICVAVTIWVARTLRRNGTTLLADERNEHRDLADAISHSLVVGFYLLNLGIICLVLRSRDAAFDLQTSIELLSFKVGGVLVGLAIVHFLVLAIVAMTRGGMRNRRDFTSEIELVEDTPRGRLHRERS